MAKPVWTLAVTLSFSASHQLRNYGGKCENMHGHNFGVEIEVEGDKLDDKIHYLMDFGDIKKIAKGVLAELDHKHLNEVPPFDAINPSSENLAMHIYGRMKGALPAGVRLASVTVSEKDTQRATYREVG